MASPKNIIVIACYTLFVGVPTSLRASTLPYSPDLGEAEISGLVAEDLRTEVRGALTGLLGSVPGLSPDGIKIVVHPTVTYDEVEGFVLKNAEVKILLPEDLGSGESSLQKVGTSSALDLNALRSQVEVTLRENEAGRLWQDDEAVSQPAKLVVTAGWYRPSVVSRIAPLRKYAMGIGILSAFFLGLALAVEATRAFRRRPQSRKASLQKVPAATLPRLLEGTTASGGGVSVFLDRGSSPASTELKGPFISANDLTDSVAHKLTLPRPTGFEERPLKAAVPLPSGSTQALQALAEMPLEEAIEVLTRFGQEDRQSIIEHLPLHPALKVRLRKGLTL